MKYSYALFILLLLLHTATVQGQDLVWAAQIDDNDTGHLYIHDNAVDKQGNIIIAGQFNSTVDIDPGPGIYLLQSPDNTAAFIAKYDSSGKLLWANTFVSDSVLSIGSDIRAIALDDDGNIYATGYFLSSVDFDPGPAYHELVSDSGRPDMFVLQVDPMGNYGKVIQFAGTYNERSLDIAVDAVHDIYLTGTLGGGKVDFDPSPAVYELTTAGDLDVFFLKISGQDLVWAKTISGAGTEYPATMTVDADGNVYLAGYHYGTSTFDHSTTAHDLPSNGSSDIFVAKYDSFGELVWAKSYGGAQRDLATGIACDKARNVYITGRFSQTVDFGTGGAHRLNSAGAEDVFVLKLDPRGNLSWVKQIGGSRNDVFPTITLVGRSVVVSANYEGEVDLDPGPGSFYKGAAGTRQLGYTGLDDAGSFIWAAALSPLMFISGSSVSTDGLGNIYVTGRFMGTVDCDPGPGVYNLTAAQSGLAHYIIKYKLANTMTTVPVASNRGNNYSIYPNPGSGTINISAEKAIDRVVVTDVTGRVIYDQQPAQKTTSLNIYRSGLYIISLTIDNSVAVKKLVVDNGR